MKKSIIFTAIIALLVASFIFSPGIGVCQLKNADYEGIIKSWHNAAVAGGECTGKLVCQNFEGTGYDNSESWTEDTTYGTVNEDYTTTVLRGSQSLFIDSNSGTGYTEQTTTYAGFTANGTIYGHFMFRLVNAPAGENSLIAFVADSSGNEILGIYYIQSSSAIKIYHGSVGFDTGTYTVSTGTTYHIWFRYTKGTGANGVGTVWIGTSTTKPGTADSTGSSGDATADAARIYLAVYNNYQIIYDQVLINTTDIGDVSP